MEAAIDIAGRKRLRAKIFLFTGLVSAVGLVIYSLVTI